MVKTLIELDEGQSGHVECVGGEDQELRRRLLEMGFCNNAHVQVIRKAPMGDPIEYRVRGYHIVLRGEQSRYITVKVL